MKAIRGHYDGQVVVLDEPAPVSHEVDVVVHFPETEGSETKPKEWHWQTASQRLRGLSLGAADEVIRQRRME